MDFGILGTDFKAMHVFSQNHEPNGAKWLNEENGKKYIMNRHSITILVANYFGSIVNMCLQRHPLAFKPQLFLFIGIEEIISQPM